MAPWGIFALVSGVAVVIMLMAKWWEHRYTEAWRNAAEQLGLAYYGPQNDLLERFGHLATLQRGHHQEIRNAIVGVDEDLEIVLADFRCTTGHGKNRRRHAETVCIVHHPALALPTCFLRPQSFLFDAIGKLFGGQDIDFPADPEFSRAYVLQGHVPEAICRLFDESLRAWCVAQRKNNLHFEAQGPTLLFHRRRKIPPHEARELLAQALQIRRLLAGDACAPESC
jgi:hypothetical protein